MLFLTYSLCPELCYADGFLKATLETMLPLLPPNVYVGCWIRELCAVVCQVNVYIDEGSTLAGIRDQFRRSRI